jgi:hypothetical protein
MAFLPISSSAALVGRLMHDCQGRAVLARRQHVLIPQRQLGKRPRIMRTERPALLLTCLRTENGQLLNFLLIVKLATLVGWPRQIVRRHWIFKQKRKPGRPRIDQGAERQASGPAVQRAGHTQPVAMC